MFYLTIFSEPETEVSPNGDYYIDGWSLICSSEKDCSYIRYLESDSRFCVDEKICDALGGSHPSFHSEDKNKFVYVFQHHLRPGAWIGLKRKKFFAPTGRSC